MNISKGFAAKIRSKLKIGEENESENIGADTPGFFFCRQFVQASLVKHHFKNK